MSHDMRLGQPQLTESLLGHAKNRKQRRYPLTGGVLTDPAKGLARIGAGNNDAINGHRGGAIACCTCFHVEEVGLYKFRQIHRNLVKLQSQWCRTIRLALNFMLRHAPLSRPFRRCMQNFRPCRHYKASIKRPFPVEPASRKLSFDITGKPHHLESHLERSSADFNTIQIGPHPTHSKHD